MPDQTPLGPLDLTNERSEQLRKRITAPPPRSGIPHGAGARSGHGDRHPVLDGGRAMGWVTAGSAVHLRTSWPGDSSITLPSGRLALRATACFRASLSLRPASSGRLRPLPPAGACGV